MNAIDQPALKVRRRQPSGSSTSVDLLELKGCVIYRVAATERLPWPALSLFADLSDDVLRTAASSLSRECVSLDQSAIYINFNSYVIETLDRTILIDCGIGNDKQRLDRL